MGLDYRTLEVSSNLNYLDSELKNKPVPEESIYFGIISTDATSLTTTVTEKCYQKKTPIFSSEAERLKQTLKKFFRNHFLAILDFKKLLSSLQRQRHVLINVT